MLLLSEIILALNKFSKFGIFFTRELANFGIHRNENYRQSLHAQAVNMNIKRNSNTRSRDPSVDNLRILMSL